MTSPLNLWRRAEQLKLASIDPTKSSNELWINRQSLQDIYQSLLIADLEFSLDKKVEQDLWNFAFKKQITTLQNQCRDKQNQKRGEVQAGLNLFLDAASGFYIQLLQEVCSSFTLDLPFRRKNRKVGIFKEYHTAVQKAKVPSKSSCLYLCQDCLVHLGDIARYKQCNDQAQTFYKHAAQLVPMNGQPYNQLAILEVQKGNKLSTIFYHTRSLAVQHPFPVAEINCNKFFARISKDGQDSRHKIVTNEWLFMFLQFLASVHLELDPMKSRIRLDRILLSFKPNLSSLGFNTQQLLQMATVLFYEYHSIVEKKIKNSGKGHSYLKPKDVHGLSSRMEDGDKHFPPLDEEEEEEEDDDEFAENDGKNNKRGILPGVKLNEKELEEVYKKRINMVLELTASMMESIFMAANEKEGELRELLLPVIKMMLDWLISNEDVVNHPVILKSGLWTMLCLLANGLIDELDKLDVDKTFVESHKGMPLPEDKELQCFLPLKKAHCYLNFTWRNFESVPHKEEKAVRMQRILDNCTSLQEMAEKSQGKSAGILTAKYTSGTKKALVSFETNVPKNKLDVSVSTPALIERRPARLNVAMQTILQKSTSEGRAGERSEGDGECAGKQSKRSLKVEFKEEVENVWKEMNSDGSQDQQPQVIDRNNNNSPHMLQNFCARPFPMYPSMPHPPPCYGPPLRAPMYQFYPLPPPPPLPFAFRPGCPLPAPPSMVPRFNPMTSLEISVTSSDSTLSDVSSKCSSKAKGESAPLLPLSVEAEFPCLPSRKEHQMTATKGGSPRPLTSPATLVMPKVTVRQEMKRECDSGAQRYQQQQQQGPCPFPSFQPMHPPSFPRSMLNHPPNAGMPFMPPQQLPRPSGQPPFGRPMMPSNYSTHSQMGQQQGQQQPPNYFPGPPLDFQERSGQNFKTPKEDVVTIPPQSSGGCQDNPFRLGGFNQGQNMAMAGMRPGTNKADSMSCRGDQNAVNIYGAQFNNHSLGPRNMTPTFDMRQQRPPCPANMMPPGAANMMPPCPDYQFQPDQSRMGFGQPQPEMDHRMTQDGSSFRMSECNDGRKSQQFMNVVSFKEPETNCVVPPLPPSAWSAGARLSDCNTAEKEFDVRLCAQRALGRQFTGPLNFSNCNNSSSEGKTGDNVASSVSSYNLFGQVPWSPVLVNNNGSNAHSVNLLSVQRDRTTHAILQTCNKPESDSSSTDMSWKDLPSAANQTLLGQISIMKSTNNIMPGGNVHQSTAWSGHQTPLEKLLQQQKQLRPNGN